MKIKLAASFIVILFLFGCAGPAGVTEQSSVNGSASVSASLEKTAASSQITSVTAAANGTTDIPGGGTATEPQDSANTTAGKPSAGTSITNSAIISIPQTTAAPNTVQLYINCINAVTYGIRNQPGYDEIIPADGVILDTAAELQENDTVLSFLKRVLGQNGISLNSQRSYIKGIGGLNDFDCGSSSGWLYSVNGVFPSYSSSQYTLKSGDKIKILYSVNSGDVTDLSAWN